MIVVLNEKEGFVLAVVNVRYNDGPVHSEAIEILGTLVRRVRGSAGCVCVVIRYPGICIQPSTSRKFIHGAVECVGAGLYDCVKAAARPIAIPGIVGVGYHLKVLNGFHRRSCQGLLQRWPAPGHRIVSQTVYQNYGAGVLPSVDRHGEPSTTKSAIG